MGYRITYYPVDLESEIRFVSVNYTTNTTTLTKLDIYTMYLVYVSAVSSGGVGPANMTMARTRSGGNEIFVFNSVKLRLNAID